MSTAALPYTGHLRKVATLACRSVCVAYHFQSLIPGGRQVLLRAHPRPLLELENSLGNTALAVAIATNNSSSAELLYDSGAKMRNVRADPPHWMVMIIMKRINFRKAYTALFGCLFKRRLHQPSRDRGFIVHKDIAGIIINFVREARFHIDWF
jgi:hypothetical protein